MPQALAVVGAAYDSGIERRAGTVHDNTENIENALDSEEPLDYALIVGQIEEVYGAAFDTVRLVGAIGQTHSCDGALRTKLKPQQQKTLTDLLSKLLNTGFSEFNTQWMPFLKPQARRLQEAFDLLDRNPSLAKVAVSDHEWAAVAQVDVLVDLYEHVREIDDKGWIKPIEVRIEAVVGVLVAWTEVDELGEERSRFFPTDRRAMRTRLEEW